MYICYSFKLSLQLIVFEVNATKFLVQFSIMLNIYNYAENIKST